ncbi:hypothetical protein SYNTR_0731 [Candidatus Syntrophocurvum alkaliphilum]|uniref:Bacterial Pleckstrin homology domain-containing protein n=1 Tax=Candidatus Syntrophocurvum alkaliphilum TaxID=2293317 RepID=A0A6I6DFB6_9FIRM|nr:PH domain-containing protein [Candidatus Syntrophocurvum alkaliphilum]QGT99324.1 hypothetical protein SYNTR_0731 [Candidatus Syntrophocurvum alkaliphilum]
MTYNAKKSNGPLLGLITGFIVFSFIIWGINFSLDDTATMLKILLYIPAFLFMGMFIFIIISAFSLKYQLTNESLIINIGIKKIELKFEDINEIVHIKGKSNLFSIMGVSWTGVIIGIYIIKGIGSAKMFGTNYEEEIIYLKTNAGLYGITPEDFDLVNKLAEKTSRTIQIINMDDIPIEEKGKSINEDSFYKILYNVNLAFLITFASYLAVFFPLTPDAPNIIILLLVLAIALFFFNIGNAGRLYQFSQQGSYFMLIISIVVTGIFLILSFAELTL